MTWLMEKDSATANQRTLFFRVFLSNGTAADTGLSNDSLIVARGSNTTFTPNALIVAVHSAQGMYSLQLSASDISNLGQHAAYYTQGDFPQHVASFCVVNNNPYSTSSNESAGVIWGAARSGFTGIAGSFGESAQVIRSGTAQGGTVTQIKLDASASATTDFYNDQLVHIVKGTGANQSRSIFSYSGSGLTAYVIPNWITAPDSTSVFVILPQGEVDVNQLSSSSTAADNLKRFFDGTGYTSLGTVGVSRILAGTYSGVTVGSAATILAGTYSGVTVGINNITAGTYSGVTVGSAATILAGTYSGVTVGVNNIAAGTYSGVTVGINDIASGTIQTADFAAAALDSTVFATDAEQAFADRLLLRSIAGGADSGRTVGVALYALRNKVDMSSSIGTVYRVDDTTSAWTFSNTTGAFPISSVGP